MVSSQGKRKLRLPLLFAIPATYLVAHQLRAVLKQLVRSFAQFASLTTPSPTQMIQLLARSSSLKSKLAVAQTSTSPWSALPTQCAPRDSTSLWFQLMLRPQLLSWRSVQPSISLDPLLRHSPRSQHNTSRLATGRLITSSLPRATTLSLTSRSPPRRS